MGKESELAKGIIEGKSNDKLGEKKRTTEQFQKQSSSFSDNILRAKDASEKQLEQNNNLPKTMNTKLYKSKKYRDER